MERNLAEMLESLWAKKKFACIEFDDNYDQLPKFVRECVSRPGAAQLFKQKIIEMTRDSACAYRLNVASYEPFDDVGPEALRATIMDIHILAPDVPVVLDTRKATIASPGKSYAAMAFGALGVDALVLHASLGMWTVAKFFTEGWNAGGKQRFVVAIERPNELHEVRAVASDAAILVPDSFTSEEIRAGTSAHGGGIILNFRCSTAFAPHLDQTEGDLEELIRNKMSEITASSAWKMEGVRTGRLA